MLTITVPAAEHFNNRTSEFIRTKETVLALEHSLVSVSKWEAKWHKPFLGKGEKTDEEILDYIKCMTISQNVDPLVFLALTPNNIEAIRSYINDPMTATTFSDKNQKPGREIITAEIIYYWMISMNIPFECRKWHLNSLLALIRTVGLKNQPKKKMSKSAAMKQQHALNASRLARSGGAG